LEEQLDIAAGEIETTKRQLARLVEARAAEYVASTLHDVRVPMLLSRAEHLEKCAAKIECLPTGRSPRKRNMGKPLSGKSTWRVLRVEVFGAHKVQAGIHLCEISRSIDLFS
jgi:hypothetical protein